MGCWKERRLGMLNTFSLNPCFAGRWVAGHDGKSKSGLDPVLILVLLEDGLLGIGKD